MAAYGNYLRETLEAMENGEGNNNPFATTANEFHLNSCASESEGDIEGMAPCGVCLNNYTKGGDHNPVMFFSEGCAHTVCKTCFIGMRDTARRENRAITCHYCRKAVTRAACVRM